MKTLDSFVAPVIAKHISESKNNGESSQARYVAFFTKERLSNLMNEYPLLPQYISKFLQYRVDSTKIAIQTFSKNIVELESTFRFKISKLVSIEELASDPHEKGQMVIVFHVYDEYKQKVQKLVFKSRGGKCNMLLYRFILSMKLEIRLAKAYHPPSSEWYFTEFIEREPCVSAEEIPSFYRRCGCLFALCQLFAFHDGHRENIIAEVAWPILIDPETLFEPFQRKFSLESSILETGLLQRMPVAFSGDCSYYAAAFQQPSDEYLAEEVLCVLNDHTDQLRIVFQYNNSETKIPPSAVLLKEETVLRRPTIGPYRKQFVDGYIQCLSKVKNNFPKVKELVSTFYQTLRCRVVLKHTAFYQQLFWQLFQPNHLSSEEAVVKFLSLNLEKYFKNSALENKLTNEQQNLLKSFEIEALKNLDIPAFFTSPSSCNIESYPGTIFNVFSSPFDIEQRFSVIISKINCSVDIIQQLILPKATLKVLVSVPDSLIAFALQYFDLGITAALSLDSFFVQNSSKYFKNDAKEELSTKYRLNLFDGLCGAAYGSCVAFRLTKEERYELSGCKLCDFILKELLKDSDHKCTNLGGAYGIGSVLYTLSFAAISFNKPEYVCSAYIYLTKILNYIDLDSITQVEFIHGLSGFLIGISSIVQATNILDKCLNIEQSRDLKRILFQCSIRLENFKYTIENALDFITGFSHGISGILFAAKSVRKYLPSTNLTDEFVENLLAIEDSYYDARYLNWKHVPRTGESHWNQFSWCHGAPGILLVRETILKQDKHRSGILDRIIKESMTTKMKNDTLCCGNAGLIEILNILGRKDKALKACKILIKRATGRQLYVPNVNYGMFQGAIGIAVSVSRVVCPEVPSILLWEV